MSRIHKIATQFNLGCAHCTLFGVVTWGRKGKHRPGPAGRGCGGLGPVHGNDGVHLASAVEASHGQLNPIHVAARAALKEGR